MVYVFILPMFTYMVVTCIYPLFDALKMSFYNVVKGRTILVGLDNYIEVLREQYFWPVLSNSFFFTGFTVLGHLLIGLGFALLLNKKIKYRNLWRALQFIPWLFSAVVVGCIWMLLCLPTQGFINGALFELNLGSLAQDWLGDPKLVLATVTVANIWTWYPFFSLMILAGLQGISKDLYEAAKVDGVGRWGGFLYITLPLLKPIILTICLLDAIWTFRFFDLIWVMTRGGPMKASEVMATQVYKIAFYNFDFHRAAALGGIMTLIMLVLCLIYLRSYHSAEGGG